MVDVPGVEPGTDGYVWPVLFEISEPRPKLLSQWIIRRIFSGDF